jgi:replicative DNA helicase
MFDSSMTSHDHARPLSLSFDAALKECERTAQHGGLAGLSTGFLSLDWSTSGMLPGQLWTIGGTTGSGKSALALSIAHHVAAAGGEVYLASLEMGAVPLVHRLTAMRTGLDLLRLISWRLSPEEKRQHIEALNQERPTAARIHVDDRSRLTLEDVRTELTRLAMGGAVSLAIVDYMQLVTASARQGTREREVAETARGLKQLAMEFQCPIIGCSQLSRAADAADEPSLSHLRESGELEHASDVVLLIGSADGGVAHLRLAKVRNGKRGKVDLSWTPQCTRFADLSLREELLPGSAR